MRLLFLGLGLLAGMLVAQAGDASPMARFIEAADKGDEEAMKAALGAGKLPGQIEGCYLRRVYANPSGGAVAAWMCADGASASRVVLGEVSEAGSKARLRIVQETRSPRPAPAREGSALAPAPEANQ